MRLGDCAGEGVVSESSHEVEEVEGQPDGARPRDRPAEAGDVRAAAPPARHGQAQAHLSV